MTAAVRPGLLEEIRDLARQRDAVILAHDYQLPEIPDVADHVGGFVRRGIERRDRSLESVDTAIIDREETPWHNSLTRSLRSCATIPTSAS